MWPISSTFVVGSNIKTMKLKTVVPKSSVLCRMYFNVLFHMLKFCDFISDPRYAETYYSYVKKYLIFEKAFFFGRRNRYQISTGASTCKKKRNLVEQNTCELLCKRNADPPRTASTGRQRKNNLASGFGEADFAFCYHIKIRYSLCSEKKSEKRRPDCS